MDTRSIARYYKKHKDKETKMNIKKWAVIGLLGFGSLPLHSAPTFPTKPITFVVPYAPGGPADLIAREVAAKMNELTKATIVVENRTGASGNIAGSYVARANKDGYTLLFGTSPVLVINPSLYKNLDFNPLTDFEAIADFGSLPNAVLVNKSLGISNIQDLIHYAKNNHATYASAGSGGTTHLSGLLFAQQSQVELNHIPFRGSGPALQSLLANQVSMTFTDVFTALPFINSGQLEILGVTSATRSELFPQVATLQEQNMPEIDINVFFALLAPKGIPENVKNTLSEFSTQVLNDPEIQEKFKKRGLITPKDSSSSALYKKIQQETPVWAKLIEQTNAQVD